MRLCVLLMTLLLAAPLWASHKMFPADGGSVARENARAEALGYERYNTLLSLTGAIDRGELVPVPITTSPQLPGSRRYIRSDAAAFMLELASRFRIQTGHYLIVDSAVRPADVQRRLCRHNRNAAPATGVRASSHERGTTFDLAKKTYNGRDYQRMRRGEYHWLLIQLAYFRAVGRILVIEERACIHVAVVPEGPRLQDSQSDRWEVLVGWWDSPLDISREDVVLPRWLSQPLRCDSGDAELQPQASSN